MAKNKIDAASCNKDPMIDYKNTESLKSYVLESGRIIPGRITDMSPQK